MPKKNKKHLMIGIVILFAILLLVDRFYWAQISQWREDQATNVWLGYTAKIGDMPVGLISSEAIPNPNGMVILGFFLSTLPNLLSVSFFLGVAQIMLLVLVSWKSLDRNWKYFLFAAIPTLSSVVLRSSSVEFWNQYTITLVNIFFVFWIIRYLENPSLWNLPPIAMLILLAPSLYLAGIVNAMVITLLTLGVIVYKKPITNNFPIVLMIVVLLGTFSILLTWLPYFQNMHLEQLTDYNKTRLGPVDLFEKAWKSLLGVPIYTTFQWADKSIFALAFKHADPRILSLTTQFLLRLVGRLYLLQAVFAFTTFIVLVLSILHNGTSTKHIDWRINSTIAKLVIVCGLFISFSYTISAWLGGPAWVNNERLDQTVQFLPMFLLLIFLLPLMISVGGQVEKIIIHISYGSLIAFGTVNLLCGFMVIQDHLQYRGAALTEADVPLIHKMQAIDFVANDWGKYSSSHIIPVDYDLGGGEWDWVPEFGLSLMPWYPAPMTAGRSFDYELLRQYGLTNYQEGVQLRTFGTGRYLVTYAFEDPPQVDGAHITSHVFGRLRVSIVER